MIRCVCCGKQVVSYNVPKTDAYCTIAKGARAAFSADTCYCGYCSEDLDENGLFPEERYDYI